MSDTPAAIPQIVDTLRSYGPFAFGMVALLTLWFSIVRPELEASRAVAQQSAQAAEALAGVTRELGAVTRDLRDIAMKIERATP